MTNVLGRFNYNYNTDDSCSIIYISHIISDLSCCYMKGKGFCSRQVSIICIKELVAVNLFQYHPSLIMEEKCPDIVDWLWIDLHLRDQMFYALVLLYKLYHLYQYTSCSRVPKYNVPKYNMQHFHTFKPNNVLYLCKLYNVIFFCRLYNVMHLCRFYDVMHLCRFYLCIFSELCSI